MQVQSEVTEVPNDIMPRQQPRDNFSSLGTVFCNCCLWTSTLF